MTLNLDPTEILESYQSHRPTGFDRHIRLSEQDTWLIAPVSLLRDSNALEISNWEVVTFDIREAETTGDDCEIHRFGHWACGWYEIMLVRPGSKCAEVAAKWACALSDYPVASDEHHSEILLEEAGRTWSHMSITDRIAMCDRFDVTIFAARRDEIPDDRMYDVLTGC